MNTSSRIGCSLYIQSNAKRNICNSAKRKYKNLAPNMEPEY